MPATALYAKDSIIYAGIPFVGMAVSNDLGIHWKILKNTDSWADISVIILQNGSKKLLIVHDGKLQLSDNEGRAWKTLTPAALTVNSFFMDGADYYVGTLYSGLYISRDQGIHWVKSLFNASTNSSTNYNAAYVSPVG